MMRDSGCLRRKEDYPEWASLWDGQDSTRSPHLPPETPGNQVCEPPPLAPLLHPAPTRSPPHPPRYSLPPGSKLGSLSHCRLRPPIAPPPPNTPRPEENPLWSTGTQLPLPPPRSGNELRRQPPGSLPFHPNEPRGGYLSGCSWSPATALVPRTPFEPHVSRTTRISRRR